MKNIWNERNDDDYDTLDEQQINENWMDESMYEEGWGDDNLVNKLKNRIADLEEKLENCTGPDFSNVSNGFHNIPGREIQ